MRAAAGVSGAVLLWGLLGTGAAATVFTAVPAVLFALYGVRAVRRAGERYALSEAAIERLAPSPRRLRFDRIEGLRLSYYTTRRDGEGGWMELRLRDGDGTMVFESEIEGFARLVREGYAAARRAGVPLSGSTQRNVELLLEGRAPSPSRRGLRNFGLA